MNIPIFVLKEASIFVCYSPVLDISSAGDSYEESVRMFSEAASILFEESYKRGTLEDLLLDLGWTKENKDWNAPELVSKGIQKLPVCVDI